MEQIITDFDKGIVKNKKTISSSYDHQTMSRYMYEQLSEPGSLPIMCTCNSNCFYCFNDLNPFPVYKDAPRSIEDVKLGINFLPDNIAEINLSNTRQQTWGEAVCHPRFFEILQLIRKKFPETDICFFTNGMKFTDEFVKELSKYKPIRIEYSVHTIDQKLWCQIHSRGEKQFNIIKNSFQILKKYDMDVNIFCIPMVNVLGYEDIYNTMSYFQKSDFQNIAFLFPAYSSFVNASIQHKLSVNKIELQNKLKEYAKKIDLSISVSSDESIDLIDFHPELTIDRINKKYKNILWLFSEIAFKRKAARFLNKLKLKDNHYACLVKNYSFGGSIDCAGLLQVNDFRIALKQTLKKIPNIDLIVLPKISFNAFNEDLFGESWAALQVEFNIKVLIESK